MHCNHTQGPAAAAAACKPTMQSITTLAHKFVACRLVWCAHERLLPGPLLGGLPLFACHPNVIKHPRTLGNDYGLTLGCLVVGGNDGWCKPYDGASKHVGWQPPRLGASFHICSPTSTCCACALGLPSINTLQHRCVAVRISQSTCQLLPDWANNRRSSCLYLLASTAPVCTVAVMLRMRGPSQVQTWCDIGCSNSCRSNSLSNSL